MTELWRDIRYGLRLLWKSPGFTSVSLLALALGIGATTAIFSLLYSVLLAPLPYVDGDRIVMVWSQQKGQRNGVSPSDYLDWLKPPSSTLSTPGLATPSPSPRPIGRSRSRPAASPPASSTSSLEKPSSSAAISSPTTRNPATSTWSSSTTSSGTTGLAATHTLSAQNSA